MIKKLTVAIFMFGICTLSAMCAETQESIITTDATINREVIPDTAKIRFMVEKTLYATIETAGNEELTLPKNPTKEHYIFSGWFFDKNVWENEFDKNSFKDKSLTDDVVVYAKYIVKFQHIKK